MKEEIWPLRFCSFLICAAVFLFLLPALAGCGRKESGAQDQLFYRRMDCRGAGHKETAGCDAEQYFGGSSHVGRLRRVCDL